MLNTVQFSPNSESKELISHKCMERFESIVGILANIIKDGDCYSYEDLYGEEQNALKLNSWVLLGSLTETVLQMFLAFYIDDYKKQVANDDAADLSIHGTEKALKTFQRKIGIKQDGLYGSETHQALMDAVADDDEGKTDSAPDTEATEEVAPAVKQVRIVCGSGSVNIRVGNDTKYGRITSVKDGTTFEWIATAEKGWHAIVVNAQIGWVSGKYSKTIE